MRRVLSIPLLLAFLLLPIAATKTPAQTETPRLVINSGGHMALIRDIMFSPDGSLLYSASDDKTVRVWDVATGEMVRVLRGQIGAGHEGKLFAAALSPDGRTLAVGGWLPGVPAERDSIRLLDARTDAVLAGLDWLEKQATQRDVAVVFMAGHGLKDRRGNYYFLPHDGDAARLRRTGVNWRDLNDVISNLPSKVLLFTDTCKAGAVTGKRRAVGSRVDITEALRELNAAGSGVVIMAASTGNELSQERPEWGHGAFTKALLEGFDGKADVNRDGIVDMKEIDLYVTNRVKELTNGEQHPTTEIPRIMPNFPLMVN